MPFYEEGGVRLRYEVAGSGYPLLIVPGGGLNATMSFVRRGRPFDPVVELGDEFKCVMADMRNANGGESTGPVEVDRPWGAYTDDHLALMDHLRFERFAVLGFCIGGPLIWNLLRRAPDRVVAAVLVQPSGSRPEVPTRSYDNNMRVWVPGLLERHPEVTEEMASEFLQNMYGGRDYVFSVSRDFVRSCMTPVLILPDDIEAHPYAVAMESARLAANSQVSLYPWKEPPELIPIAVRHVRMFLLAHRPKQQRRTELED